MYFLYIIMLTSQYMNLFIYFVKSIQRNFFNSMWNSSGFLLLAILVQLLSGQWFCCKVRKTGKIQTKTKKKKKHVCEGSKGSCGFQEKKCKTLERGECVQGSPNIHLIFFQSPFQALISTEREAKKPERGQPT